MLQVSEPRNAYRASACTCPSQCYSIAQGHQSEHKLICGCLLQGSSRRGGPEIQNALAAQQLAQQAQQLQQAQQAQQAEQAANIKRLQEQLDASLKAVDEQKAAAQKLEQVITFRA